MKSLLTKLLLALSLVANPVAVLAGDFHDVEMKANQTMEESTPGPAGHHEAPHQATHHDSENCDMPCCEDSDCAKQEICVFQHSSCFVAQRALIISHPLNLLDRDAFIAVVPERKFAPDNPPPIYM